MENPKARRTEGAAAGSAWAGRAGARAESSAPAGRGPLVQGALLFVLVAGIFLPAVTHDFITYDDPVYVTENAHVTGGLTWANVAWAFRSTEASNWHPLTWLSHMADCEIFGLNPAGHHLTNVLLHAVNAVLLFVVLRMMTGCPWRSFLVAALFGLHPLHVESVAWVSERKDVLSTLFWMLALWAYARRLELERDRRLRARVFYGLALLFFALGLMSKQMVVTLPCVLLLLDYWPLNRWAGSPAPKRWALLAEKLPFLALSAAASAVTLFAQSKGEAVVSSDFISLPVRFANALIAYCRYLGRCFLPVRLAAFYPYLADRPPLWETAAAGLLLAAVTAAAAFMIRRRPYLVVGWLWFLGTLVPVIGLVQVGGQSMADRYSYVPLIGVFIMVVWASGDAAERRPRLKWASALSAAGVLALLAILTVRQLGFWADSTRLFRHALDVTHDNWVAHANLSAALAKSSPINAGAEFNESVRILAKVAESHDRKGLELERTPGRSQEAIGEFRAAIQIMPDLAEPHYNLGTALAKTQGRLPEAIEEFRAAVRLRPDFAEAHYNLATALANSPGGQAEAVGEYEAAARLRPDNAQAHYNLAYLLSNIPGREIETIAEYRAVIRLRPETYQAHFNLGIVLSGIPGRAPEAIGEFEAALRLRPDLRQARDMIERLQAAHR